MRRVTVKIMIATLFALIISSFIPNLLVVIFKMTDANPENINPRLILIVGIITVTVPLLILNFFINQIIMSRVRKINHATKQVMQGDYNINLPLDTDDEITDLMHNFNDMAQGLQSNEYLNKAFVRNFSHELKTPLSAIKGYADLMVDSELTEDERKVYSRIISNEADRLSSLSRNMLQISLIDSQNIIKKNDDFNVAEQVRNVMLLQQIDWETKNIELDLDLDEIYTKSNKELTYQIWQNLFSNAVRFTPNNGKIKVILKEQPNSIMFEIENDGMIEEKDQDKIFDLFYVAEKSRNKQSSGVGLTLTKKIISRLGGTIEFHSKDSKTKFIVTLNTN